MALLLGKTLSEIKEMSWEEFMYWTAYLAIEPPDEGDNKRTAALMAQITNMSGRSLPDKKFVDADDFLGKKKQQTAEQQLAFMRSINGS